MTVDDLLASGTAPVVAILRGVAPDAVLPIGQALVDAGIRLIEVPFNSPDPTTSIRMLQEAFGDRAAIGAGTVLDVDAVEALVSTGGTILVTPNTDPAIIAKGVELGLEPMPGFVTPSEAFRAIAAGARRLKLFPAVALGPAYLKAVREVLPKHVRVWAVGGTDAGNFREWLAAGAEGIGVGGALYRPGDDAATVGERARAIVAAWRTA